MDYLAADIGGTKTDLMLVRAQEGESPKTLLSKRLASQEYPSFSAILRTFFTSAPKRQATRGCLALAGPVQDGVGKMTNLPWGVNAEQIAAEFGLDRVIVLNDVEAHAFGVLTLQEKELATLHPGVGKQAAGNRALIAAGTGLGMAGLLDTHGGYRPFASEGGHTDFAPKNLVEIDLLRFLTQTQTQNQPHLSYERLLSGKGFTSIYRFLQTRHQARSTLTSQAEPPLPQEITARALSGGCELCLATLELFCSIYGSAAGNLALTLSATGGIYLGGGIAPKILPLLRRPHFLDPFFAKGRFEPFMRQIPIHVILDPKTALRGALRVAEQGLL